MGSSNAVQSGPGYGTEDASGGGPVAQQTQPIPTGYQTIPVPAHMTPDGVATSYYQVTTPQQLLSLLAAQGIPSGAAYGTGLLGGAAATGGGDPGATDFVPARGAMSEGRAPVVTEGGTMPSGNPFNLGGMNAYGQNDRYSSGR